MQHFVARLKEIVRSASGACDGLSVETAIAGIVDIPLRSAHPAAKPAIVVFGRS